jgi:molybdopterin molybdotransferase
MIEVSAAREIVLRHAKRLPAEITALTSVALGHVLADDITADLDSPPFDKSMMDGYAVRSADCVAANVELRVTEEVAAGGKAVKPVGVGEAVRIFTGAMIPAGADAVVKQEETTAGTGTVRVHTAVKPGQNILRRGQEMKAGDVVVSAGALLSPVSFGVFAAVGKTAVPTVRLPRVCVVVTGNELVEPNRRPTDGQIRNTNGPMLMAQAERAGTLARYLGIATDETDVLASYIREGLEISNVLVLAGGVSVGKYDKVPDVLKELGVQIHFHTVRMKPGKPVLFGTAGDKLVFGLPGNPVSAYLGFELFVRPALGIMRGRDGGSPREVKLPLSEPLAANHDRPTYHPAVITQTATGRTVKPLPWFGSADLKGLLSANGFIILPPGEVKHAAGDVVPVLFTHG